MATEKFLNFMDGDIATQIDIEDLGKGQRRLHINKTQDVAPLLRANQEARNDGFKRRSDSLLIDETPFTDIPMSVVADWIKKYRFDLLASPAQNGMTKEEQQKFLRKLLNHPDYAYLKLYNGRL